MIAEVNYVDCELPYNIEYDYFLFSQRNSGFNLTLKGIDYVDLVSKKYNHFPFNITYESLTKKRNIIKLRQYFQSQGFYLIKLDYNPENPVKYIICLTNLTV